MNSLISKLIILFLFGLIMETTQDSGMSDYDPEAKVDNRSQILLNHTIYPWTEEEFTSPIDYDNESLISSTTKMTVTPPPLGTTGISHTKTNISLTSEVTKREEQTKRPPVTPPVAPLPNFDPPNYKYKVLKNYSEDYVTPSVFLLIGVFLIILTIGLHKYMDSKQKERQVVTGTRFKPERKRKDSTISPTIRSSPVKLVPKSDAKGSPVKPVPTKSPNSRKT